VKTRRERKREGILSKKLFREGNKKRSEGTLTIIIDKINYQW